MSKGIKITCDEATTICDKNQYREASLLEKIKLQWHLFLCKHCTTYTVQNKTLSNLFKKQAESYKDKNHCMSTTDKETLKKVLKKIE